MAASQQCSQLAAQKRGVGTCYCDKIPPLQLGIHKDFPSLHHLDLIKIKFLFTAPLFLEFTDGFLQNGEVCRGKIIRGRLLKVQIKPILMGREQVLADEGTLTAGRMPVIIRANWGSTGSTCTEEREMLVLQCTQ